MTAPLYQQTGKLKDMTARGSHVFNRRRCIQCDSYHDLMHFAADSLVCDACAVAAAKGREASAGSEATLPCLNSNNSIQEAVSPVPYRDFSRDQSQEFSTSGKKSAAALEMNVHGLIEAYGINNCAFVTLTFADEVTDPREASRRFNSLNTNFLRHQINGYVGVFELHKSGRIHFHFVVNLGFDCRTGFDFEAVANGNYSSACPRLRSLWKLWRERLPDYGFGRFQVVPIKGGAAGIANYVAKYVGKSLTARKPEHKGFRLVRCSMDKKQEWKRANSCFSFISAGSRHWRECLKRWFLQSRDFLKQRSLMKGLVVRQRLDETDYDDFLRNTLGSKWAFFNRRQILAFGDFETERPLAA